MLSAGDRDLGSVPIGSWTTAGLRKLVSPIRRGQRGFTVKSRAAVGPNGMCTSGLQQEMLQAISRRVRREASQRQAAARTGQRPPLPARALDAG